MANVWLRHPLLPAACLLLALCAAVPAQAQNPPLDSIRVYHVYVPESAVRTPTEAPQACTVRDKDPVRIGVDTTVNKAQDSVWVMVVRTEGTTRTPIKPPSDVDVYVAGRRRTLVTTMDAVALTAAPRKLEGERVTVQEPNTGRVFCSVSLPGVSATTRAPGRPLPAPEAVVSIGASFDLLDGLRANDLYSDARVFAPGLWRKYGIQAGIYQGRVSAKGSITGDTAAGRFTYQSPVLPLDTTGGVLVRHRTYERNEFRTQNTLGLYMGVNHAIGDDLFAVALLEIRRQNLRHTITDTLISDTTLRLQPGQEPLAITTPGSRRITQVAYEPAVMVGPRLDLRRESFNLVLQPLGGITRVNACKRSSGTGRFTCQPRWSLLQWDVTFELEAAKSGIKLGGEVRGFQSETPEILVFLAKEFTVEKFAEFLTGAKR